MQTTTETHTVTLMINDKSQGQIQVRRGYVSRTGPAMWIEVAPKQDRRCFALSGDAIQGNWRIEF